MGYGSPEVNALIARVHQILNQSGAGPTSIARSRGIDKQQAERQLHEPQPAWHHIEFAVRHCIELVGGQDRHGWLEEVRGLWTKAQPAGGPAPRTAAAATEPDSGSFTGPGILGPLLDLVLEGRHGLVAEQVLAAMPGTAGAVEVLQEVGRRSPAAAAAVLQEAAGQAGREVADAWMEALADSAQDVAAAVRRHLPPDEPEPAEPAEPVAPAVSVADLDPLAFDGRRLALLVRRGETARAVTDVLLQTTPEPTDDDARPRRRTGLDEATARAAIGHEGVRTEDATRLVLALRQGDAHDAGTLAAVLGELVVRDHTELAALVLQELHQEEEALTAAVLRDVPRPRALAVLAASTTTRRGRHGATRALVVQAPPTVAADFLLAAANASKTAKEPVDLLLEMPHQAAVLQHMAAGDYQQTARVLNAVAEDWDLTGDDTPERLIARSFLHVARTDPPAAARVLLQFLRFSTRSAADLLFLMETASAERDATTVIARTVTCTLELDPQRAAVLIARMACRVDFPIRLLERVAIGNPAHNRLLAAGMIAQDLPHVRSQIPAMIRQQAITLTTELLQHLGRLEPEAPWNLIRQALTDGATPAALANADAYVAGL
ncbi:hypothetical protein KNE206_54110 [Kitasatospora sp. NE20-6]